MIELDAIATTEDMQNIIDNYKGDINVISAIKKALSSSNHLSEFIPLIPSDDIEQQRKLLVELQNKIDFAINPTIMTAENIRGGYYCSFNIDYYTNAIFTFINQKFDDDFNLIEETPSYNCL